MTTDESADTAQAGNVLRFELDLDALAPWTTTSYDYEMERERPDGPPDLLTFIVDRAAAQMLDSMDREERRTLQRRITAAVDAMIVQHADRVLRETLATAVVVGQPGRPDNKRTLKLADPDDEDARPLHEVIEERCREWLDEAVPDPNATDRYRAPQITRLAAFAREASQRKVNAELRAAFDEGRNEVKAALREQGAAILQEAIERQATAR